MGIKEHLKDVSTVFIGASLCTISLAMYSTVNVQIAYSHIKVPHPSFADLKHGSGV